MASFSSSDGDARGAHDTYVDLVIFDEVCLRRAVRLLSSAGLRTRRSAEADKAGRVAVISHAGSREARAREIHRLSSLASVVAIVPETGADVAMAVRAGARGVVFEDRLGEALVPTVGAVRAGQLAVPRRFHRHAVKPRLSYRERQVLGLMAIGVGNAGIATAVGLETSTVKSHVSAALAKLGVRTRREAAAVVVEPDEGFGRGILDLPIVQRERTAANVPSRPGVHSSAVEGASR